MYRIIAFKTGAGGGVGFLREGVSEEELKGFLVFNSHLGECPYEEEDTFLNCDVCIHCTLNHPVREYNHIGEVSDVNVSELINFQDKFYYQAGDCC